MGRDLRQRVIVLLGAAAGFAVLWWPTHALRTWILQALGNPPYRGPWILFEHALLDTLLPAVACALIWHVLAKRKLVPAPRDSLRFERPGRIAMWGVAVGLAVAAFNVAIFAVLAWRGLLEGFAIEYVPPNGWDIAGNVVSNFYEEFIARGFIVVTMRMVFRNTPVAVAISSLAFGFGHTQFPVFERCFIAVAGAMQCLAYLRTRSVWSPYIAHEVYDLLLDCAVKVG